MAAVDSFTSQLRSTLILSRSKLDQWVEHQKEQIDVAAEAHRVAVESGQARIDAAVTDLLALQLKGGLALSSSSKPNDKTVSKEVQEILKKRQAIDEQMVELRAQLSDKAAVIQGKLSRVSISQSCSLWLTLDHFCHRLASRTHSST